MEVKDWITRIIVCMIFIVMVLIFFVTRCHWTLLEREKNKTLVKRYGLIKEKKKN